MAASWAGTCYSLQHLPPVLRLSGVPAQQIPTCTAATTLLHAHQASVQPLLLPLQHDCLHVLIVGPSLWLLLGQVPVLISHAKSYQIMLRGPSEHPPLCSGLQGIYGCSVAQELQEDLLSCMHLQYSTPELQLSMYPPHGAQYVRHRRVSLGWLPWPACQV